MPFFLVLTYYRLSAIGVINCTLPTRNVAFTNKHNQPPTNKSTKNENNNPAFNCATAWNCFVKPPSRLTIGFGRVFFPNCITLDNPDNKKRVSKAFGVE